MKKNNIYTAIDVEKLKKEISSTIEYLETFRIEELEDDINWYGIPPKVISTIEKQVLTLLQVINTVSSVALALFEKEGNSLFVKSLSYTAINSLKSLQYYYESQPIAKIEHRYNSNIISTKRGDKTITLLTSSKEDIISNRVKIIEKILKLTPLIENLEDIQKERKLAKGQREIPPSMQF